MVSTLHAEGEFITNPNLARLRFGAVFYNVGLQRERTSLHLSTLARPAALPNELINVLLIDTLAGKQPTCLECNEKRPQAGMATEYVRFAKRTQRARLLGNGTKRSVRKIAERSARGCQC